MPFAMVRGEELSMRTIYIVATIGLASACTPTQADFDLEIVTTERFGDDCDSECSSASVTEPILKNNGGLKTILTS
jgi:hypothetical protein